MNDLCPCAEYGGTFELQHVTEASWYPDGITALAVCDVWESELKAKKIDGCTDSIIPRVQLFYTTFGGNYFWTVYVWYEGPIEGTTSSGGGALLGIEDCYAPKEVTFWNIEPGWPLPCLVNQVNLDVVV